MKKSSEFIKELNISTQNIWKNFVELLKSGNLDCLNIISFKSEIKVDDEFNHKYGLSSDINSKVDPKCYYIVPEGCQEVSTLKILQECIKQDTYKPDIKKFQYPEVNKKKNNHETDSKNKTNMKTKKPYKRHEL